MKVTREQLQTYFDTPLPSVEVLADAFTFHAFEIDSVEGDLLDIKVLPNRAADCATPDGVARELAAILDLPTKLPAPEYSGQPTVAVTVAGINATLGADFSRDEILGVFRRLAFKIEEEGETLRVTAPAPRTDISIPEDVAEEVGQILGYDRINAAELPPVVGAVDQARWRGIEKLKDELVAQGFTEISTQSFAKKGDIALANPMDKTHPYLRTGLARNLSTAFAVAKQYAPLILAPNQKPKLFEIGAVFPKTGESIELCKMETTNQGVSTLISPNISRVPDHEDYIPTRYELGAYKPFSNYPFMTRDIAFWAPASADVAALESLLRENAGELLARLDLFDRFEKEGKVSYAFRLVFQAFDRTLTDDEVNAIMDTISASLSSAGYEVR